MSSRSVQIRLFITCWMIFTLHFATNFVREHYLVLSIVDDFSFRLDQYADLHVDIFETPEHGAHHGANPGASMIAAIPYLIFKPVIDSIADRNVSLPQRGEKEVTAVYKDTREARTKFYKQVRERGLDIKFGLVGAVTMVFCMAPLSAFSAVVMFRALGRLGLSDRLSLGFAFLYALGTPVFFRTHYLNQNLMIGIFGFSAFVLIWQHDTERQSEIWQRYGLAGFLSGLSFLCDYSGFVTLILLGGYGILRRLDDVSFVQTFKDMLWYAAGATGPVLLLWLYQWRSFGNPFYPGQHYMPPVEWIEVGYQGVGGPSGELFRMLLFDLRFGLFIAAPILLLALLAPLLRLIGKNRIPLRETLFVLIYFLGFTLFFSCVQYTRLQWIKGIRYIIPVIPFLFLLTVSVMMYIPRLLASSLAIFAIAQAWCMSMVSDDITQRGIFASIKAVFLQGFQLPWLTTFSRMATQYDSSVNEGGTSPIPLFVLCGVLIYAIWRIKLPWESLGEGHAFQTSRQHTPESR